MTHLFIVNAIHHIRATSQLVAQLILLDPLYHLG